MHGAEPNRFHCVHPFYGRAIQPTGGLRNAKDLASPWNFLFVFGLRVPTFLMAPFDPWTDEMGGIGNPVHGLICSCVFGICCNLLPCCCACGEPKFLCLSHCAVWKASVSLLSQPLATSIPSQAPSSPSQLPHIVFCSQHISFFKSLYFLARWRNALFSSQARTFQNRAVAAAREQFCSQPLIFQWK